MALGSLAEVQNQLLIAKDINYITKEEFDILTKNTVVASKIINGLIKKTKILTHNY